MPIDPMTNVAMLSLAWFVTGVLAGRMLSTPKKSPKRSARRRSPGGRSTSEVYVGNLPYGYTERDIRKLFSPHAQVAGVRLIKNRANGKSKGYGFVEMPNSDIPAAIKALSGRAMKGRKLVVNEAKSRARGR